MIDYYPPPKSQDQEEQKPKSAFYLMVSERTESAYKMIDTITKKPSKKELKKYAYQIKDVFADGFQWKDVITMMSITTQFLDNNWKLTMPQKRKYH